MNRRVFLKSTAGGAAFFAARGRIFAFQQSPAIQKFVLPLPGLAANGIPIAKSISAAGSPFDLYDIRVREFTQQVLPSPFGKTRFWGYVDGSTGNARYLGPLIAARKGRPVKLRVTNELPRKHFLPIDTTLMGAESDQFENRITVHLHGGFVPWTSDGGPFSWFTPGPWPASGAGKHHGIDFLNGTGIPGQAEYYYPNEQSARLEWYHDHALGITRLNAYAGIVAGYLLGDDFEDFLIKLGVIPSNQLPLIIQDKSFNHDGSLWYPSVYEGPPAEIVPELPDPWVPLNKAIVRQEGGHTGCWERDDAKRYPSTVAILRA